MSVSSCDNDRTLSQILFKTSEEENRDLFEGNRSSPLSEQSVGNTNNEGQWSVVRNNRRRINTGSIDYET